MAITDRRTGSVVDIAFGSSTVTVTAPTVAQVNALTRVECFIVDGPETPRSGSTTDISSLCERETYNIATTITNGDITMTLWREFAATEPIWTLFDDSANPPTTQYLIICRGGFSGAAGIAATGNKVDVYTVQTVSRQNVGPNKEEGQRFEVTLAVVATNIDKVVA
jgi:hypothetical protein